MLKKITSIPFHGTPEQEAKLQAVIEESKSDKSLLMHVMQEAQEIYGYLPRVWMCRLKRFTAYPHFMRSFRSPPKGKTTYLYAWEPRAT